ncbi:hypothetical protein GOP47_0028974 [Adiantum capillus-veneris]|nr:hypothetical protein GOP47_0028974 [Adiantum capillus-veneris]
MFNSPNAGGCTRAILDKLGIALFDSAIFTQSDFYLSGTGISLLQNAPHISATLKNWLPVLVWTSFGGFYSEDAYADRLLKDTSKFDFARILKLYYGRHRFSVTALERYIAIDDPSLNATDYLIQFGDQISKIRGLKASAESMVGLSRTIFDDVIRFFGKGVVTRHVSKARHLVADMVALHFFACPKMAVVNPSLSLVEFGLAR